MVTQAHPDAMKPSRPGSTRTAAPVMAGNWWWENTRYRAYVFYAFAGAFFWVQAALFIEALWAIGSGEDAWNAFLARLEHPLYIAYHVVALLVFVWYGARTYFKLFVKTQPPMIGPMPRPPVQIFPPALAAVWIVASVALVIVLWGVFP